jgi:hypothetical protein
VVLALKLILTPTVVILSTLAGRRFGRVAAGWFVGLPLTSGPIAIFFAVEHGRRFAADGAMGSLGGATCEVVFCAAYAATARRRGWRSAVVVGSLAFATAAALSRLLALGPSETNVFLLVLSALVALAAGRWLVPHVAPPEGLEPAIPSKWDIPARAAVATGLLLVLTGLATQLGPGLAGVIAVYPLYTIVLASFAHAHAGEHGAVQILRGLIAGLYSFVCFYAVLPLLLTRTSIAVAFTVAYAASFTVQGASLARLMNVRVPRLNPR